MKSMAIATILFLSGCANLSDRQKTAIKIGAVALIVGAIAVNDSSGNKKEESIPAPAPNDPCGPNRQHCL